MPFPSRSEISNAAKNMDKRRDTWPKTYRRIQMTRKLCVCGAHIGNDNTSFVYSEVRHEVLQLSAYSETLGIELACCRTRIKGDRENRVSKMARGRQSRIRR